MQSIINRLPPLADWSDDEYNHQWVLADNVIKYLLKPNPRTNSEEIAKTMRLPVYKVKEVLELISRVKPHLLVIEETNLRYIFVTHRDNEGLQSFLYDEGGFTGPISQAESDRRSEIEYREAEFQKIHLEIGALKRQQSDARWTRILAWIAIGISLLPFVVEAMKRLF